MTTKSNEQQREDQKKALETLKVACKSASASEIVKIVLAHFGPKVLLASSLGAEDQVLTHMAMQHSKDTRVFVLDTGRLHHETYEVLADTKAQLKVNYEVYYPNTQAVQEMVNQKGINLFYDSVENRKQCCHIRKVEPLQRALATGDAWITGLRRSQAVTRAALEAVEWDDGNQKIKINPLYAWSEDEVWQYLKSHEVPYNKLHDHGFPSIGCAPCTRAIEPGEDVRAGRWWWESPEQKECGLHMVDGKLVRKVAKENGENAGPMG